MHKRKKPSLQGEGIVRPQNITQISFHPKPKLRFDIIT